LLFCCGVFALFIPKTVAPASWDIQIAALIVVVGMAFQNTFGKLFNKSTYGLTTVMTGNVTQAGIDLMKIFSSDSQTQETVIRFRKQIILIIGFLAGCLIGAVAASAIGLPAVIAPAILLAYWLWYSSKY
jgi:uncharacterized membrane protein YoaK (UPF0700 family)